MYDGYVALGDTELVNKARTGAYIRRFLPGIDVRCKDADYLHVALQDAAYTTPAADAAPWYRASNAATAKFYGLFPATVEGGEDSTREVTVTEQAGDGAIQSLARHGSRELRFRVHLFALDEEGMEAGIVWLRSVLDNYDCGGKNNCDGEDLFFYAANPSSPTTATALANADRLLRVMHRTETLSGPRVVAKFPSKAGQWWEVEFILNVGRPWQFTLPVPVTTTTNIVPTTVNEVYCPTQIDAYDELVVDPQEPGVARPPRPPLIKPVVMPSQWNRYQMTIGATFGERAGRLVPVVKIKTAASVARKLRVRFYRNGYNGACDFEGEFFVTYVPADSTLTIDGPRRKMTLLTGGVEKPAGNLVIGSDGRPALWPTMSCNSSYFVVVDSVGALAATVTTDISIRE